MSDLDNASYFRRRAAEETAKCVQASNERVAVAHAEMARRYEKMAAQLQQCEEPPVRADNESRAYQ